MKNTKRSHCKICNKTKDVEYRIETDENICFFCRHLRASQGEFDPTAKVVAVFCDGGLIGMNRYGGTWAWCGVDEDGFRVQWDSGFVPQPSPDRPVTNNHTEQIAIVKALEAMPKNWSGLVYSDSKIALGRVFRGYRTKNLPQNIIDRTLEAYKNAGIIEPVHLQGHPTREDLENGIGKKRNLEVSIHNVWCDLECERQREAYFRIYNIDGEKR